MHYYSFNIGDYSSHTNHLSIEEDIAYRRMLDWYYLHESPLPNNIDQIARLIRMRTHTESIANVLEEFFELTEYGYKQSKADRDINAFKSKSEKAKASAAARWSKDTNKADANALRPECESNANHKPITNNQEPINTYTTKHFKEALISAGAESVYVDTWIAIRKKKKATNSEIAFNSFMKQVGKSKLTVNQCLKIACEESWSGFKAHWLKNIQSQKYETLTAIANDDEFDF